MTNKKGELNSEQIKELSRYFIEYKDNKNCTTNQIGEKLGVDRTTIGNYFKKLFGVEYRKISKQRARYFAGKLTPEQRLKLSLSLKGISKPPRSLQHKLNLSKAMSKSFVERFGEERAKIIKEKISNSNLGRKHVFKNKGLWKRNLSNSLKGRKVWNKDKKGLQKAWNKKELSTQDILDLYLLQSLSARKIANKFNVSQDVILRILKEKDIKIKGTKGFLKGKKLSEILGKERAELIIKKLSEKLKLIPHNWGDKISKSLREYYKQNSVSENKRKLLSVIQKNLWKDPAYRNKLIDKHKEYLKQHPEELERLKKIQCPGGITSVEQKMLNFLRNIFKENEDFYFDKQDLTGKTFYRPDFQFPKRKIIIEVDGYYKHYTKEGYRKDKIREYYLNKAGWSIYRFNFYDINKEYKFKEVKNKIINILGVNNVNFGA